MTEQEKELLLKDLCGRLQYGVKAKITEEGVLSYDSGIGVIVGKEHVDNEIFILQCKNDSWCLTAISEFAPYLRSMSSMTEEEAIELCTGVHDKVLRITEKNYTCILSIDQIDWLNSRHFDYRGLIDMGLAIEAPEGMYETKTE